MCSHPNACCFYFSSFGDVLFGSGWVYVLRAQMLVEWALCLSHTADCSPDDDDDDDAADAADGYPKQAYSKWSVFTWFIIWQVFVLPLTDILQKS